MRSKTPLAVLLAAMSCHALAQAQEQASPARASLGGGSVVVRQFLLPAVPIPGTERPGTPQTETAEFRLEFAAADVQAFRPDGTPVDPQDWRRHLKAETAVLYGGYAILAPGAAATPRKKLNLPAEYRSIYRNDALVLIGNRPPLKQERVKQPKLPAGAAPRFGMAALLAGGWFRLVERQQVRSHYPARLDEAGTPETHVVQTTATTTTRDVQTRNVECWDLAGKTVQQEALSERLESEIWVVVSADGKRVDPYFLSLVRPDVLIVAIPQPSPQGPKAAPPGATVQ